jgi:hypothetical protein
MRPWARVLSGLVAIANLVVVLILAPGFGVAAEHTAYMKGEVVLDRMVESGAVTIDENKGTVLQGYRDEYRGNPAIPIVTAALESTRSYYRAFPCGQFAINMVVLGFIAIFGGSRARAAS